MPARLVPVLRRRVDRGPGGFAARARLAPLAAAAILGLAATACRAPATGEVPPWVSSRFVRLRGGEAVPGSELWLVPVRMGCPHCLEHLAAIDEARAGRSEIRTAALIVGGRAPLRGLALEFRADEVWWDRAGIWRRLWDRDDHGCVLVFDAAGRFVRLRPAGAGDETLLASRRAGPRETSSAGQGVPPDDR